MSRLKRLRQLLFLAAATMPLFQGTCVDMAQRVLINGFFNWFNGQLVDSQPGADSVDLP